MSQPDIQSTMRRGISTRSVVIVILLVGLGAGAVGYGLNNAFATTNPSQQSTATNGQCSGLRVAEPVGLYHDRGSSLSFRAFSTETNVTATVFANTYSNHFTITIADHGNGSTPD